MVIVYHYGGLNLFLTAKISKVDHSQILICELDLVMYDFL
jgi:hypothetical protein